VHKLTVLARFSFTRVTRVGMGCPDNTGGYFILTEDQSWTILNNLGTHKLKSSSINLHISKCIKFNKKRFPKLQRSSLILVDSLPRHPAILFLLHPFSVFHFFTNHDPSLHFFERQKQTSWEGYTSFFTVFLYRKPNYNGHGWIQETIITYLTQYLCFSTGPWECIWAPSERLQPKVAAERSSGTLQRKVAVEVAAQNYRTSC